MDDQHERERQLAATAARMFYVEDATKIAIGEELGISRFKVARLLELARAEGIVTITMNDVGIPDERLSARLAAHLGLRECLVVSSHGNGVERRTQVGTAAARYLEAAIHTDDVLGLAWGRTLGAMTSALRHLPVDTIVQLTGVAGAQLSDSPVEIVRQAALSSNGTAHAFFVPQIVRDAATAVSLSQQPDVAATMRLFERVTVAVVSVGSWNPPMSQIHEVLTEEERARLRTRHIDADVAGILLDQDGARIDEGFVDRSLSIRADQFARIPRVIAVASGTVKTRAVRAVARSGMITGLVTDRDLAEAVLGLGSGSGDTIAEATTAAGSTP